MVIDKIISKRLGVKSLKNVELFDEGSYAGGWWWVMVGDVMN